MKRTLPNLDRISCQETKLFRYSVLMKTHRFSSALQQIEQSLFVAVDIETVTLSPEGDILEESSLS